MDDRERAIREAEAEIKLLKSRKRRDGTKIHYAEVRLSRLREKGVQKTRSNRSPKPILPEKKAKPLQAPGSPQNRAYVLSGEVYDLTQAIVALERMRKSE